MAQAREFDSHFETTKLTACLLGCMLQINSHSKTISTFQLWPSAFQDLRKILTKMKMMRIHTYKKLLTYRFLLLLVNAMLKREARQASADQAVALRIPAIQKVLA